LRITVSGLVEVLQRLERCENMAQVCWIFDKLPVEIKTLVDVTPYKEGGKRVLY
jgi:hypothetical protein